MNIFTDKEEKEIPLTVIGEVDPTLGFDVCVTEGGMIWIRQNHFDGELAEIFIDPAQVDDLIDLLIEARKAADSVDLSAARGGRQGVKKQ
jgi:hypothetical protein